MEYLTHSLIDKSDALQIVKKLRAEKSSWQDGKKTAGSHAAEIKSNFQLDNLLSSYIKKLLRLYLYLISF